MCFFADLFAILNLALLDSLLIHESRMRLLRSARNDTEGVLAIQVVVEND